MNHINCQSCFKEYDDDCLPKLLECCHSMCYECLKNFLIIKKGCPICSAAISKPLEEYQTNVDLLTVSKSWMENEMPNLQLLSILSKKKNLLLARRDVLIKTVDERNLFLNKTVHLLNSLQKLMIADRRPTADDEGLAFRINKHLNSVDHYLRYEMAPKIERFFILGPFHWQTAFIDLKHRLEKDKIFACEYVVDVGYRYGEMTFNEGRFYINSLTTSKEEDDKDPLVWFKDIRRLMPSIDQITLFIRVGKQILLFTLTDDNSFATYRLIKFFTGETERVLKDNFILVTQFIPRIGFVGDSQSLNNFSIKMPLPVNNRDYDQLFKGTDTRVYSGDVVVQCFGDKFEVTNVPVGGPFVYENIVAVLHENCTINYQELKGRVVDECGISFLLHEV